MMEHLLASVAIIIGNGLWPVLRPMLEPWGRPNANPVGDSVA